MRYLFCSLASHGYVYPTIYIARELQRRGHEVAFVTGKAFADTLAETGLQRFPSGPKNADSFTRNYWSRPVEIIRQVKHIQYASKHFGPDALIATPLTLGPLIAAQQLDLPVAMMGFAAYLWPRNLTITNGVIPVEQQYAQHMHTRLMGIYEQACKAFHLPVTPNDGVTDNPLLGDMYLMRGIPSLEGNVETLPANVHFIGDCLWEPPTVSLDDELQQWLEAALQSKEPILFVQHVAGTGIPDYWPNLIKALADKPVRVLAAGNRIANEVNDTLPSNFLLRPFVPYAPVLPFVDGVIASGTTSIVLTALAHALPMLLVPIGGEQPHLARRCEHAGIARILSPYNLYTNDVTPENITPARLNEAINELLAENSSLRQNAQRLQAELVHHKSSAATQLEKLLSQKSMTPPSLPKLSMGMATAL